MRSLIPFLFYLFSHAIIAQIALEGSINNAETNESIPYVNIGIMNKGKGTVSDDKGNFSLVIPNEFLNDTMRISSIGYDTKLLIMSDFITILKGNQKITLMESVIKLQEVLVSDKKIKEKILGNKTKSKMMRGGFRNAELGNELGIKIPIKKKATYIHKFHAHITSNTGEQMKFRLNFYGIENGLPSNKIVTQNIIFQIASKEGNFTLDLSKYDIVVDHDFFLTVELIENHGGEESEVFFSAGLLGNATVTRLTSQAQWEKLGSIGIGFSLSSTY